MIHNVWTVLCKDIITDQETNAVTYVRCIEEGSSDALPLQIGPVFLGTLWEKEGREKEAVQFRIVCELPDHTRNTVLQTKPVDFERMLQRLHFRINTLDVSMYGTYRILLEYTHGQDWRQAAKIPVVIRRKTTG